MRKISLCSKSGKEAGRRQAGGGRVTLRTMKLDQSSFPLFGKDKLWSWLWTTKHEIQLTPKQLRSELCGSTYTWTFFNKYMENFLETCNNSKKHVLSLATLL